MSKYVKDLMVQDLKKRLDGVGDCLVANMIGLDSLSTYTLRKRLREKNIRVLVVQNSMVRRAAEGTSLAPAFEGLSGTNAVVWAAEDFVSLVKEIVELDKDEQYKAFEARGLSQDRISQARREATMGYELMESASTGRRYEMPLETYDGTIGGYRNPNRPSEILVRPKEFRR